MVVPGPVFALADRDQAIPLTDTVTDGPLFDEAPFSANRSMSTITALSSVAWVRLGLALGLAFVVGFGLAEHVAIVWRWWRR